MMRLRRGMFDNTAALGGTGTPGWVLASGGVPATLDLDFVNDLAWNAGALSTIPALLACARASAGYYTNAAGLLTSVSSNALRYGSNGLLVEGSKTNLLIRSQTFATSFDSGNNWGQYSNGTVVANNTTAPDGTLTATSLTATGAMQGLIQPASGGGGGAIPVTHDLDYSFSVYVKGNSATQVAYQIRWWTAVGGFIGTSGGAPVNIASGVAVANGFYRVTLTATAPATAGAVDLEIWVVNANDTMWIWGAQFEQGSGPSSYIPTTTAAVTKAADVVTYSQSLSVFTPAAGTLYAQVAGIANAESGVFTDSTNDTFGIVFHAGTWQTVDQAVGYVADSGDASLTAKVAGSYAASKAHSLCVNAGTVATGTATNAPAQMTHAYLGNNAGASGFLNGYLKRLAFWNTRLSNGAMQTLTT